MSEHDLVHAESVQSLDFSPPLSPRTVASREEAARRREQDQLLALTLQKQATEKARQHQEAMHQDREAKRMKIEEENNYLEKVKRMFVEESKSGKDVLAQDWISHMGPGGRFWHRRWICIKGTALYLSVDGGQLGVKKPEVEINLHGAAVRIASEDVYNMMNTFSITVGANQVKTTPARKDTQLNLTTEEHLFFCDDKKTMLDMVAACSSATHL